MRILLVVACMVSGCTHVRSQGGESVSAILVHERFALSKASPVMTVRAGGLARGVALLDRHHLMDPARANRSVANDD